VKRISQRVEHSLKEKIKSEEEKSVENQSLIQCDNYLSLARLYNSEKMHDKEIGILNRFLHFGRAALADIPMVTERLNEAKALFALQRLHEKELKKQSPKRQPPITNLAFG